MIISNAYFTGELYIPHAKPGISDDVTEVSGAITGFINEYAEECLVKCLGIELFYELNSVLDIAKPNGLVDGSLDKWNALLNGSNYLDPASGKTINWRGIRYKNGSTEYNKSFLANYVYFFYEKNDYITRSDAGHQILEAKNATTVLPTEKVIRAWNKFVEMVQGAGPSVNYGYKHGMPFVDYYNQNSQIVSLSKFIKDSNKLSNEVYPNYNPHVFRRINTFGI